MSGSMMRMVLGGAVCGSFLGIFSGGVLGGLYGWFCANVSYGLDSALFGGCAGLLCGSLYGAWQARLECQIHSLPEGRDHSSKEGCTIDQETPVARAPQWKPDSPATVEGSRREAIPQMRGQS
jgi:hypothetical protein